MNLTKFLAELRKTRNGWTANGGIVKTVRGRRHCPITAVCLRVKKTRFSIGEYEEAGQRLGLSPRLTTSIVDAADWDLREYAWMRSRLLKAVGK